MGMVFVCLKNKNNIIFCFTLFLLKEAGGVYMLTWLKGEHESFENGTCVGQPTPQKNLISK